MTMTILFPVLVVLVIYWHFRNIYYSRLSLKYKYRFFALRDELRRAAIAGDLDPESKAFRFLDESLCQSVANVDRFNVFTMILAQILNARREGYAERIRTIHETIDREPAAKRILNMYAQDLGCYFTSKHYFLVGLGKLGIRVRSLQRRFKSFIGSQINSFIAGPYSSPYDRYFAGV
jgi:hypothetical protein